MLTPKSDRQIYYSLYEVFEKVLARSIVHHTQISRGGGGKLSHMKNALFGAVYIAIVKTPKSAFFYPLGYLACRVVNIFQAFIPEI